MKHARRYDGALAQVTRVLSASGGDTEERRLHHASKGCCFATIITSLLHVGMKEVEVKIEKDVDLDNNNEKEGGKKRSAECITLKLRGDVVY